MRRRSTARARPWTTRWLAAWWLGLSATVAAAIEVPTFGTAVVHARSAALLMSGQEGGELPMNLLALPTAGCGQRPNAVTVWLEVAGDQLLDLAGTNGGELDIMAYMIDASGAVVDRETRRLWIDPARHEAALRGGGLVVALQMEISNSEASEVRVLALWPEGPFGVRSQRLRAQHHPAPWPALFPRAPTDWALNLQPAPQRQSVPPLGGWPEQWIPQARPMIRGPSEVYLFLPDAAETALGTLYFQPRFGGEAVSVPLTRAAMDPTDDATSTSALPGCVVQRATFDPSPLPSGVYDVVVRPLAAATIEPSAPFPAIEVWVGEASSTAQFESGPSGAQAAVPEPHAPEVPTDPGGSLRRGYRLALLAGAQNRDATDGRELVSFQRRAFDDLGSLVLLERVESRALHSLTQDGSATTLAIAQLHAEAALGHHREGNPGLVRHALRRVLQLLAQGEADQLEVAEVLGSIGAWALRRGYIHDAHDLLTRAVDLSPTQSESQLLLAALEEKTGRHAAAVARLQALATENTEEGTDTLAEVRLRYAVNLARTGNAGEALKTFGQIAEAPGPPWVRQLAAQEEVRLLRRSNAGSAQRKAQEALDRWPDQPELLILVSFFLEQEGHYEAARELVASLAENAHETTAPRSRYEEWPDVARSPLSDLAQQTLERQRLELIAALERKTGP